MKNTEPLGRITTIGTAAHELLTPQLHGKILAVVSEAAYLLSDEGELLWLATENVSLHRRCMQLPGPLPRLAVDSTFNVTGLCLNFQGEVRLDFSQASTWMPFHLNPGESLAFVDIPGRLSGFISLLDELSAPAGFARLIPEIMQLIWPDRSWQPTLNLSASASFARTAITEIAQACLARDMQRVLGQAGSLIGLGEGLTPSGDDFIGGLLFCHRILQSTYGGIQNLESMDLSGFMESLKHRTNLISQALLRDHADGYGMDILHRFIRAFLSGQPLEDARHVAERLVLIGHSTGWDLLAGVLTGMLLAVRSDRVAIGRISSPISGER